MRLLSTVSFALAAISISAACSGKVSDAGRALPAHCYFDSDPRGEKWPVVMDPNVEPEDADPAQPVATLLEPTAVTEAFRNAWFADVVGTIADPSLRELADTLAPCMRADEHYAVQRVSRRVAFRQVHELTTEHGGTFRSSLVAGDLSRLSGSGWVWAVTFLGGSRKVPPSGAFAGYVDPATGKLLVAVHWPEG